MKIALIGYGKMGMMVEQAALSKGHAVVARIGSEQKDLDYIDASISNADACIDFSHPSCAIENIKRNVRLEKNMIMGTTGWYEHIDQVKRLTEQSNIGFLYSPNFSLGVALFLEIVSQAAALFSPYEMYDVGGSETHHNQKADSPSGTAKEIAKRLLANVPRKKGVLYDLCNAKISPEQIHFPSLRLGSFPGTHSVTFDSPVDSITLTHSARNREGFAMGAVEAAEWLHGKKGFFTLNDMILK